MEGKLFRGPAKCTLITTTIVMFPTSSQCVCNFDPKALFLSFGCLLLQHTRSLVIITFVLLRFGYVYEVALGVGHLGLDDRVVLYFFSLWWRDRCARGDVSSCCLAPMPSTICTPRFLYNRARSYLHCAGTPQVAT